MGKRKFFCHDTDSDSRLSEINWEDIADRPFGEETLVMFNWNGNTSKATDVVTLKTGKQIYRVGDCIPQTAEEIKAIMESAGYSIPMVDANMADGYSLTGFNIFTASDSYGVDRFVFVFTGPDSTSKSITCYNIPTDNFASKLPLNPVFPKKGMWLMGVTDELNVLSCEFPYTKLISEKYLDGVMAIPNENMDRDMRFFGDSDGDPEDWYFADLLFVLEKYGLVTREEA